MNAYLTACFEAADGEPRDEDEQEKFFDAIRSVASEHGFKMKHYGKSDSVQRFWVSHRLRLIVDELLNQSFAEEGNDDGEK